MTSRPDTMQTAVSKSTTVIETPLDGELILLDPSCGEMYSLNPTGQFVWERLGVTSLDQIAVQLVEAFDVTLARAEADVRALVADLSRAGLVRPANETQTPRKARL